MGGTDVKKEKKKGQKFRDCLPRVTSRSSIKARRRTATGVHSTISFIITENNRKVRPTTSKDLAYRLSHWRSTGRFTDLTDVEIRARCVSH